MRPVIRSFSVQAKKKEMVMLVGLIFDKVYLKRECEKTTTKSMLMQLEDLFSI